MSSFYLSFGQMPAEVKGIIQSDTVWTKLNSPITLTAPVLVNKGTVLSIEPDVTVNLNGYYIQVNGTLIAKGTITNLIQFIGDGDIRFSGESTDWSEQTSSGCLIENTNISIVSIQINDASPKIDSNFITAGLSINGGSPQILNNRLQTIFMGSVIQVTKGSPIIRYNEISTKSLTTSVTPILMGVFLWKMQPTPTFLTIKLTILRF
jgi:hypothetical protein